MDFDVMAGPVFAAVELEAQRDGYTACVGGGSNKCVGWALLDVGLPSPKSHVNPAVALALWFTNAMVNGAQAGEGGKNSALTWGYAVCWKAAWATHPSSV